MTTLMRARQALGGKTSTSKSWLLINIKGYHVNDRFSRTDSKATLRTPLVKLAGIMPAIVHQKLASHPLYAQRSDCLIIQCDESRKQSENAQACLKRLYQIILATAHDVIPGETSDSQKNRVLKL